MKKQSIRIFRKTRTIEELNSVYIKILQASKNPKIRSIMISSCNKGEGASTVAVNLARIFAQKNGSKTLLIDANLHNAALENVFNVEREPGLTDLINDSVDIKETIKETDLENLKLLPAGSSVSDPKEIFNSEAISQCLEKLKRIYRFIVLDSAPIIPYADSLFLSSKVDMVLLAIEADKTRLEVAQEAIKKLSKMGISVFGTILNKKKFNIPTLIYKRL
jgi:capsular exopolysaccharide synthesis family protein